MDKPIRGHPKVYTDTVWSTFQDTPVDVTDDINGFTESVMNLICKTTEATVPITTVKSFLKLCDDRLAPMFSMIFSLSLAQSAITTCFKKSTIIPVSKKTRPAFLNDSSPVALTYVVMNTGSTTVCLPSQPTNGWRHSTHPPHRPIPSGQERELCEITVHWLQFSCILRPLLSSLHCESNTAMILKRKCIK